jgi:predicted component of type VI protein secretion system
MDDPDHLTQTTAVVDRALPSISEVRKAIEDHILTLEPRLKILNQHVSDHVTLMEAATLTIDTDLQESGTCLQRTQSPRCHL